MLIKNLASMSKVIFRDHAADQVVFFTKQSYWQCECNLEYRLQAQSWQHTVLTPILGVLATPPSPSSLFSQTKINYPMLINSELLNTLSLSYFTGGKTAETP